MRFDWYHLIFSCIKSSHLLKTEYQPPIPTEILPLPMFMQLNDILLLSKLTEDDSFLPMLKQNSEKGRTIELFKLPKTRTEKARNDFFSVHAD